MLKLYFWTTPNGYKPLLFLEEANLDYALVPVNISTGDQFQQNFLQISPNNRIPALVDEAPKGGGSPISVFESGAILVYLAEKTARFLSSHAKDRAETLQWLFWQMGGLGPMAGQNHHFVQYAPEKIPYAIDRYVKETSRLYEVLDRRLAGRQFIAGDFYSIADMASYPWVRLHEGQRQDLGDFPNLKRWVEAVAQRPATVSAYEKGRQVNTKPVVSDASRNVLFNQGPQLQTA